MKRILILILTALIALLAAYIFLINKEAVFSKETSLYKAVPVSSPVFIEVSSLKAIPKDNKRLYELSEIEWIGSLLEQVQLSVKTIDEIKEIQSSWTRRPFILAYDFVGDDRIELLIISKIKSSDELKGFEKLLGELSANQNATPTEKKYSGYKIFSLTAQDGKTLYYSASEGLLLLSTESIMVEKGLRQLNSENLSDIRNFNKVSKTVSSGSEFSLFINHNRFAELLSRIMNSKTRNEVNEFDETERINLRRKILETSDFASWTELDMRFDDNLISMNGITAADDSLNHYITIFKGQNPERCNAEDILPRNTSYYFSYAFSDRDLFFENLIDYFSLSNNLYDREEQLKKIERSFGSESRETLKQMVKSEVIAALTDISAEGETNSLFIINLSSIKNSKDNFEKMLQNYANRQKIEFNSLLSQVPAPNGKTYRIYKFPFPSFPGIWLGEAFGFANSKFAVFYNDYLVFASSEKTMQDYLSDLELDYKLGKDRAYSTFIRSSESKANINTYANISRLMPLNSHLFNSETAKEIENISETLHKIYALNWQMVCEKDLYFNSLNIGFCQQASSDGRALWTCNLGAELAMKPQIVENHTNPSQKNIIVQDDENRLHLISAEGTLRWTIPINGRILSEIHQIDFLRNGKWQFLFNTKEKLYLIDINGNNVAGFPVAFESPATNGVSVFDYDNNRKYRYFVALENQKVLALDQNGMLVSGWNFDKTESVVTTPVQHFRVAGRDYIVFKDAGKIYIQDRRGETRVKTSVQFENSDNPLVLNLNGTPKIVATDTNGKVFYLYFDGKYAEKNVGSFGAKHFFTVDDLDGNNIPDFVFVDGEKLEVYDENGKKLYNEKVNDEVSTLPGIYTFGAKQKMVGLTENKDNRIYLYNSDGKQYEGFPFHGNSAFSIGALTPGQLSLVVGNDDEELVCYGLK